MKNKKMTEGKTSTDGVGEDWKKGRYGNLFNRKFDTGQIYINEPSSARNYWEVVYKKFRQIGKSSYNEEIGSGQKAFKSKSQALKFAKSYMRTH